MIVNFAERAHNHNWELDPVTRSLLDTDFYKLLMLQFIWKHFPKTHASFSISNRSSYVHLADQIAIQDLIQQLEHVRKLRFRRSELVWLAGNTFYGRRGIFENRHFLEWLDRDFAAGGWCSLGRGRPVSSFLRRPVDWDHDVGTLRAVHPRRIANPREHETSQRVSARHLVCPGEDQAVEQDRTPARGSGVEHRGFWNPALKHSFLWHEYVVNAMDSNLGACFIGTSNAFLAHKHDLEAIGTNAHEIPMVALLAALAPDDERIEGVCYTGCARLRGRTPMKSALRIMLPDTFGTCSQALPPGAADGPGSVSTARMLTWRGTSISNG